MNQSRVREKPLSDENCYASLKHKLFSGYRTVSIDEDEIKYLRRNYNKFFSEINQERLEKYGE